MGNHPCYSKQKGEHTTRLEGYDMGQCHGKEFGCADFGSGQAAVAANPEMGGSGHEDLTLWGSW